MADSRFASIRYIRAHWPLTPKVSLLIIVFIVSLLLRQTIIESVDYATANAFFLLVFAAGLWITEAIPPFAVSILIIGFAMYFLGDVQTPGLISENWKQYINTWSSPIILILMGGFFMALGAQITQFDRKFSRAVLSWFGTKPYGLLLGFMLTTGILSMFMSNTATTAMMVAVLIPIIRDIPKKDPLIKALYLGVASAGTVGGIGSVIGSPPNAITVGNIQNHGMEFTFLDWMIFGVPISLFFILMIWFLLKHRFKTACTEIKIQNSERLEQTDQNTLRNRIIVVITFVLTIGLWLTSNIHHIPVAVVSFIPVVFFTVSGIIRAADLGRIPWDTLLLVAGGLTLGLAITETGLAHFLISKIPAFNNPIYMLLLLGLVTMLFSNIMSNTATASILIPLSASIVPDYTLAASLVIGLCASTALFLPISTPPNAIVYSTGYLKQSDFRYIGGIIGIGGSLIIVTIISIFYL
ncbi:MAG: DASS family sodium-coupled anion symporter [Bacteroidetes bacterium]|nr:DASS family sodium-coupled anion symporter [Bacteroidota bacterium]